MESDVDGGTLGDFLAAHKPVEFPSAFAPGDMFGDWRVTAFLGRGGSGEVYRAVHATLGTEAALKVCVRDAERDDIRDAAVCARFRREARMLADNAHPAFPRFLGFGEREGRPWYAMELLEHRPLPTSEKAIARFLLAVASGVRHLHSLGLVHRDIKPANILWRKVGSRVPRDRELDDLGQMVGSRVPRDRRRAGRASLPIPVLIDLGLVKDTSAVRGHAGDSLSIVDGKAVGVGTPRYAAPEQLTGDEVTFATDVYALGMLANDCFGGKPPRAWRRVIQRAAAAVPAQRYATVDAFIRAVRLLWARNWIVGAFVVATAVSAVAIWMFFAPPTAEPSVAKEVKPPTVSEGEKASWRDLCRNFTTNVMTWHAETQPRRMSPGENIIMRANARRSEVKQWAETNKINAVQVNLDGRTIVFTRPLDLDVGREYWIVGPGVLDAQFSVASTATVHIANCTFRNRTTTNPGRAGINYVLDGGAYLNFTELPNTEAMKVEAGGRIRVNAMSEGRRWWRIKGPNDIAELVDEDNRSSIYSATMESN